MRPARTIPTPFLRVDLERFDRNVRDCVERATACGANLRPNVKTHGSIDLARRQLHLGSRALCCATIWQAQKLLAIPEVQVLIANNVVVDRTNADEIVALAESSRVVVSVGNR